MKKKSKRIIFNLLLISFCSLSAGTSQDTETQKNSYPFTKISAERRTRLIERLQQYIDLNQKKKWAEAHGMISQQFKKKFWWAENYKVYVEQQKARRVKQFTAHYLEKNDDETDLTIKGCASWTGMRVQTTLKAYWQDNDWYFGTFFADTECTHCVYYKCKH